MLIDRINGFTEVLDNNRNKKYVIWGVGSGGKKVYKLCERFSIEVSYFIDKAYANQGRSYMSKEIKSPDSIPAEKENGIFILVASSFFSEIKQTLESWGFHEGSDFIDVLSFDFHDTNDYDARVKLYVEKQKDKPSLFKSIEIETINRCNNNCAFCPVNVNSDIREFKQMSESLFDLIISQLSAINYNGIISIFSNNEPFMDERLEIFLEKARTALPLTYMHLFTNGTLLTMERFLHSMRFLDLLIIDNYDNDYEFLPTVKQIYDYCKKHDDVKNRVKIIKRGKDAILTSRGGQAPNKKNGQLFPDITCFLPFQQMVIRPDGKVSLCCNDAYGKYTLGDLNKQPLLDIWYGDEYRKMRENILQGRKNIEICSRCDTLMDDFSQHFMSFYPSKELLTIWA